MWPGKERAVKNERLFTLALIALALGIGAITAYHVVTGR